MFAGTVSAQSTTKETFGKEHIQVEPAFQEYVLSENVASIAGKIKVYNQTSSNQVFQVFAADIQQYDSDGKVVLSDKPLTGTDYSLADFIQLDSTSSAIPSQTSADIMFTIRNSPDLQPGGHYSALVVRSEPSNETGAQQVLPALSSFLLIRKVGGEHFNLSLLPTEFAKKSIFFQFPKSFSFTFNNQGNTHLTPHGLVEFKDLFGRVTHKGSINEDSVYVLPSTRRDIQVELKRQLISFPVMIYTVKISGTTTPGDVAFTESSSLVYVHPLVMLLPLLLIGLGLFAKIKTFRKK